MSARAGGQLAGFEWAVWLILAGIWPRIATYGVLRGSRDREHSFGDLTYRRQSPYVELNVLALDIPAEKVANSYRRLRSRMNLVRCGQKMKVESEILCLAALEAKEIDELGWEDKAKFREAVLRRYCAKAKLHEVDTARFTRAPNSWDKARKVLRRAEGAYAKLFPPSTFPVKSPHGPQTLVADEPSLFSKNSQTNTRLVDDDRPPTLQSESEGPRGRRKCVS